MGNLCCIGASSSLSSDDSPRPRSGLLARSTNNFAGTGRTLDSAKPQKQPLMPSAADADLRPRDGPGTAAVDGGGDVRQAGAEPTDDNDNNNDKDNAEAVQRREMMRRAAESRSAPKGGSLARELDRRKKKGMQGEREAAAAEAVRQREIDQLQKARQGD